MHELGHCYTCKEHEVFARLEVVRRHNLVVSNLLRLDHYNDDYSSGHYFIRYVLKSLPSGHKRGDVQNQPLKREKLNSEYLLINLSSNHYR